MMPVFDDDELPEDAGPRIRDLTAGQRFEVVEIAGRGADQTTTVVYRGWVNDDPPDNYPDAGPMTVTIPTEDPTQNDHRPTIHVLDEQVFANQVKSGWQVRIVDISEH